MYGLNGNDRNLSINIFIWSRSYEDEQVWKQNSEHILMYN